jgi:hypothetical protein
LPLSLFDEPMGGSRRQATLAKTLQTFAVDRPDEEAASAADLALDLLAGALADLLIAEARAEVAAELGLDEAAIDREQGRAASSARPSFPAACGEPR